MLEDFHMYLVYAGLWTEVRLQARYAHHMAVFPEFSQSTSALSSKCGFFFIIYLGRVMTVLAIHF